jgi:hypothetical protein
MIEQIVTREEVKPKIDPVEEPTAKTDHVEDLPSSEHDTKGSN